MFFRAEEESYARISSCCGEFCRVEISGLIRVFGLVGRGEGLADERRAFGEAEERLFGSAAVERASAEDECGVPDSFGEGLEDAGVAQQLRCADGGFGFHPIAGEGSDDGETRKAEVGQGAGGGTDIQRVARGNEQDVEAVALVGSQQVFIVAMQNEPRRAMSRVKSWERQRLE